MKKMFFAASAAVLLASCGQKAPEHQLTGHLDGLDADSLIVYVINESFSRQDYMDTIAVTNGDFVYDLKDPSQLRLIALMPKGQNSNLSVLLVPGEYVRIDGTMDEYFFSGSKFYEDYNTYDRSITDYQREISGIMDRAREMHENGTATDSAMQIMQGEYEALMGKMSEAAKDWAASHPDQDVSAYIISALDGSDYKAAVEKLAPAVRNGKLSPYIQSRLDRIAAEEAREAAQQRCVEGAEAPDFTVLDPNGKPITLSSLRGKALVLDFWGSWCVWCIKGIPDMKTAYKKYSKKVEFLSIACNDTDEKWRAALEEQQMPWLQAFNGTDKNDVSVLYGIQGYPTKILIDADGKIVKTIIGEDPAFYELLDKYCKK
ncbi:MAG: AhpC/TSA family protein [Bacteroidales bacterium]|nr:AhpC/TSA family protein [Bacteroidales bacterium]